MISSATTAQRETHHRECCRGLLKHLGRQRLNIVRAGKVGNGAMRDIRKVFDLMRKQRLIGENPRQENEVYLFDVGHIHLLYW